MITQEQIDQFHRDGFLALRGIFPGAEIEALRRASEPIIAEGTAFEGAGHNYHKSPDGSRIYWGTAPVQDRSESFRAAAAKPELLEAIGQCLGHPFLPVNAALVTKLPSNGAPVKWHQDPPYQEEKRGETFGIPNFTVDIYLDRSTLENSCLWGIAGHHLAGHVDLARYSQEELFARAHPLEMEPGDVLFHSLSSPHGSAGNQSAKIRRILYFHFMCREVAGDGYPQWKYPEAVEARKLAESYVALRRGEASPYIRIGDDGFEFTGAPKTPPWHWRSLVAAIAPEEKQRLRAVTEGRIAA